MKKNRLRTIIVLLLFVALPLVAYFSPRLLSCEYSYPKATLWMGIVFAEFSIFVQRDLRPKKLRDWIAHFIGITGIMFWTELVWDSFLMQRYYDLCSSNERAVAALWLTAGLAIFLLSVLLFSTTQYKKQLWAKLF